jgi:hypothetical protein
MAELAAAWAQWHRTLDEMRAAVEATPRYRDHPEHRAQAIQSLLEAEAMVHNQVIAPRPERPRCFNRTGWNPDVLALGQPAADGLYGHLLLDGRRSYTLRGRIGEVRIMLLQVYNEVFGHAGYHMLGNYDVSTLAAPDGTFEITCSAERPDAGPWIPLDPASGHNFVLVRRFFDDWFVDMGSLDVEVHGAAEPWPFTDEAALARRLEAATSYLRYLVVRFTIGLYDFYLDAAGGPNRIDYSAGETIPDIAGNPVTYYGWGVIEVGPEDAVIVEQELPDSAYWSFQLGDVWSRPIEPMHRQSDLNARRAVVDADGRVRAVISRRDPGVPNWLDPGGRSEMVIVTRNYRERSQVAGPVVRTVPFAELREHLPAGTPTITAERRAEALAHRTLGLSRLFEGR